MGSTLNNWRIDRRAGADADAGRIDPKEGASKIADKTM